MQKLEKANLYRSELIPISGKLVGRYNTCLEKLGFSKTKLKKFSIDGIGWSPEIAEEKKDQSYLNNGEANAHGIFISPLQEGKPVYNPFHSFDRGLLKEVFKVCGNEIRNITRDAALCIDLDQGIDAFYEPLDVLKYNKVSVKFHLINNLREAQIEQLRLIEEFNKDTNFIDEKLHHKILESAKKYGDLRDRKLDLDIVNYSVSTFYTKAFGGVYVLRDFISPIVVFEDEKTYKEAIKDTTHDVYIYHIKQPELIKQLREHVIIDYDLDNDVNTDRYDRIKKYVFSQKLKKVQHPIRDILTDDVLFKSYLNKIAIKDRKEVMGVELFLEKSEISNEYKIDDIVDEQMFYAMHSPHSSLQPDHQDLIWKLLVNIAPKDILFLYWYDKEEFYKQYKTWDDSLKDWVIEVISNNI